MAVSSTTWTQTVTVSAGTVPDSAATPALPAGSYQFLASFSGDSNYAGSLSAAEPLTIGLRSPTLITIPGETVVELRDAPPPLLTDTAVLSGGFNPTGSILFRLFRDGVLVHQETVTVNGNGSYTTPMGFQLPTSGTVAGDYLWVASYSGDPSNNPVFRDTNGGGESVTVIDPTPTLVTTASPTTVTLGPNGATLTDTATLSGGFFPTGDIVFELFFNGDSQPVFSQAVTVNGNGNYTTSTTLPSTGPAGTYQWVAVYGGDPNNNTIASVFGDEPVTVSEEADLSVVKQFDAAEVTFGFNVAFTLTVHNNGPSNATGVTVTDPLPAGLLFVSATGPGSYDPATGVWTVGDLPAGATAVLQVVAQVVAVGPIVNTAIVGGGEFDPDLSNNESEAVVVGLLPGGQVTKRAFLSEPGDPGAPPSVRVGFGPEGEVVEVVSAGGVLTQFDASGAHVLGAGVRAASAAYGPAGEVLLVTFQNGVLVEFDAAGAHMLGGGVLDASAAFGPQGEVMDVVYTNGLLVRFDASGAHTLGGGVQSASVAFDATGSEVQLLTFQGGTLALFDRAGEHVLGGGVRDAAVEFAPGGSEVLDVIFQDDSLFQFDGLGAHALGTIL